MYRKTFEGMNCSIARALDQIGEWWTLLIVRECSLGTTRFDALQQRLGIARNILTNRLNHLIENGILEKVALPDSARFFEYRLTPKGEALYPVLIGLLQWAERWVESDTGAPIRLVDDATGKPVEPVALRAADGRALGLRDIRLVPGPGATDATRTVIANRNQAILGERPAKKAKRAAR